MSSQTQREGCVQVLSTVPCGLAAYSRAPTLPPAPKKYPPDSLSVMLAGGLLHA